MLRAFRMFHISLSFLFYFLFGLFLSISLPLSSSSSSLFASACHIPISLYLYSWISIAFGVAFLLSLAHTQYTCVRSSLFSLRFYCVVWKLWFLILFVAGFFQTICLTSIYSFAKAPQLSFGISAQINFTRHLRKRQTKRNRSYIAHAYTHKHSHRQTDENTSTKIHCWRLSFHSRCVVIFMLFSARNVCDPIWVVVFILALY